jgi:hypothetical protein
MDEPKIRLSPQNTQATAWKWEILLNGKQVSSPHFSRHLIECCGGLISAEPQPAAIIWS